jgi:hypothetical protein
MDLIALQAEPGSNPGPEISLASTKNIVKNIVKKNLVLETPILSHENFLKIRALTLKDPPRPDDPAGLRAQTLTHYV